MHCHPQLREEETEAKTPEHIRVNTLFSIHRHV